MKKLPKLISGSLILMLSCILSPIARAQAPVAGEAVLTEIQQLESLRAKDAEGYREAIRAKKEKLKSRMDELRGKQGEKFQSFLQKEGKIRKERLHYFQERHPRAFDRFMERRMGRLNRLAERHPEQFRQFSENHPRFKDSYEKQLDRRRMQSEAINGGGAGSPQRPAEARRIQPRENGPGQGFQSRERREMPGRLGPPDAGHERGGQKSAADRPGGNGSRRRR